MTGLQEGGTGGAWDGWRVARWTLVLAVLLVPLGMMQVNADWHWTPGDFVAAGVLIGGVVLLYEFAARATASGADRAGVAIALVAALLSVWTTIVRDDGTGIGYFLLVMTAAVGAFAAWLRPAGMARAMLGVAIMQVLLTVAIATAPSTANVPGSAYRMLSSGAFFTVLWLASAACFYGAAKRTH